MLHNVIAGATSKDSDCVGIARTCADEGKGRGVLGARLPRASGFYVLKKILPRNPFEMAITYANSFYMLKKSCRETPLQGVLGRISILLSVVLRLR